MVMNLPAMWETWVRSLGWEDLLEEGMATHSSVLVENPNGQRSLRGYSPWGHKESDTTEWLSTQKLRSGIISILLRVLKINTKINESKCKPGEGKEDEEWQVFCNRIYLFDSLAQSSSNFSECHHSKKKNEFYFTTQYRHSSTREVVDPWNL